jgi:6-phosphogluconolactonase
MTTAPVTLERLTDGAAITRRLAERLRAAFVPAAAPGGAFAVMLAGGSTPLPTYRRLAEDPPVPAPGLHLLLSDERYVPTDAEASNYRRIRPLVDALRLPAERVLRVRTELALEAAAAEHHQRLTRFFEDGGTLPLGLLGLGADGHTAGLFEEADLTRAPDALATWVRRADGLFGITVTPALLARVDQILFVVAGEEKREALGRLLTDPGTVIAGRAVAGHPRVHVLTEPSAYP